MKKIKNKILIYLLITISILLCIPSIAYLSNNKTVDMFDGYYTFTLVKSESYLIRTISGLVVIGALLIFSLIYISIIKKEKKIFKNSKQIFILIAIISFIFMLILPYLSSDIFYYIGDSWLASKYGENPYYTTVSDLQEQGINDEILNNTGYWSDTVSVYGPLWNIFARILVSFSFGNLTVALFIFKMASYLIHLFNSYLIYKTTKSKKYMLLYGLNPLVLIEFMSNVHNDIYLVFFTLLAGYFLVRRKNIYLTMLALALSVSVKYTTVLFVPFVLIYCFRDKTIPKRILYCLISGLSIIAVVILLHIPYYRDITVFTNMIVEGSVYSQSLLLFLIEHINQKLFLIISSLVIPVFIIGYIMLICVMLFKNKINIYEIMRKYNIIMLIFIFIVLSRFQKWYMLWLFPTIIWQNRNMRKIFIYMTITAMIPSIGYFMVQGDPYIIGMGYSITILLLSVVLLEIDLLINKSKRRNNVKLSFNRWK